jgi:hypothetical protein
VVIRIHQIADYVTGKGPRIAIVAQLDHAECFGL